MNQQEFFKEPRKTKFEKKLQKQQFFYTTYLKTKSEGKYVVNMTE